MTRSPSVIAFLGPSLRADEARTLVAGLDVRPPARQGDVLAAVRDRPRVIALIDGVFESQPSVWHQELRIALAEGIHLLGASSMGALRACELAAHGMRGVGAVFEAYRTGRLVDDADVALLHADAEHDFRPLTLPLVTVVAAAERALSDGVFNRRDAAALVTAARSLHYKDRRWPEVYGAWRASQRRRAAFDEHRRGHPVDPKADDARACLAEATRRASSPLPVPSSTDSVSVWARRAWVAGQGVPVDGGDGSDGLRTLLLADLARSAGLTPDGDEVRSLVRTGEALGLDTGLARRFAEALVLEKQLVERPGLLLPKAPSPDEGRWVEAMRSAAMKPVRRTARRPPR